MKLDDIETIRSGSIHNILDLDEVETGFEVTSVFEDLNSGEDFIIDLERGRKRYTLFIRGELWELYEKDIDDYISYWSEPDISGDIKTFNYREGINAL